MRAEEVISPAFYHVGSGDQLSSADLVASACLH